MKSRPIRGRRDATRRIKGPGFTLVEMLVVLIIIGIAAAMVIPSFGTTGDLQAVSAAKLVASALQYAQNVAVTTQATVKVVFDVGTNSYRLTENDSESTPLKHPINKSDYVVNFASQEGLSQVHIASAIFGAGSTVCFDAAGSPDNAGNVVVQAGTNRYRVDVAVATGRVTVTPL